MKREQHTTHKRQQLVLGFLERISRKVFSQFPEELTALAGKQHGVYTLYKGDRLYYVGLASNLRNRIKHHLRDRHAAKWDRFSLYLVRKADHIRELESLILRIADPRGNATKGRLPKANNLRASLESRIREAQERQLRRLMGTGLPGGGGGRKRNTKATTRNSRSPTLAPYVTRRFRIRAMYKGKSLEARVRSNGKINFNGVLYNSPSSAGKTAIGRNVDGWRFWRFRDKSGEWVRLDELRKA